MSTMKRGLFSLLFSRYAMILQFFVAQVLLLLVLILQINSSFGPERTEWVFWSDYGGELGFLGLGLLAFTVISSCIAAMVGFVEAVFRRLAVNRKPTILSKLARVSLVIGLNVAFLVLVMGVLLFSFFFGDGCIPMYGGRCPPTRILPYLLFYLAR